MNIVILLLLFFILVVVAITGIARHKVYTPYTSFSIIWSIIIGVYLANSSRWVDVSPQISLSLLMGSVLFLICSYSSSRKKNNNSLEDLGSSKYNLSLFIVFSVLTIIVLSIVAIENLQQILLGMSFNDILNNKKSEEFDNSSNPILTIIAVLVARPFVYATLPILGLELSKSKKNKVVIILSVITILLYIFQSARRSIIVYILAVLFIMFITAPEHIASKKRKRKMALSFCIMLALSIFGAIWLSEQRDTTIGSTAYAYIAGGIPSFSEHAKGITTYYCGAATLHGFLVPLFIGLNFIGYHYPQWYLQLDSLIESADIISIGPNEYINAFNTMFYIFYLDFGYFGVIIGSIILGIIFGRFYKRMLLCPNEKNRCVYALLIIVIVGSMYTLYFSQYPFALSFFYLYLLFRQKSTESAL